MEIEHILSDCICKTWVSEVAALRSGDVTRPEDQLERACRVPGSSVRLQLQDLGMKWPRFDMILSADKKICPRQFCQIAAARLWYEMAALRYDGVTRPEDQL